MLPFDLSAWHSRRGERGRDRPDVDLVPASVPKRPPSPNCAYRHYSAVPVRRHRRCGVVSRCTSRRRRPV